MSTAGASLSPSGIVYGVVFAAGVDQPDVGWEVAGDVARGAAAGARLADPPQLVSIGARAGHLQS